MIDKKVPQYLEKIGRLMIKGLKKSASTNGLKLETSGLPVLFHLSFNYGKDKQAIQTLFTQEMLKRGILASVGVYVSYSFKEEHVKRYLAVVDEVFAFLKKAIEKNKVYDLLKGSVAHTGFRRLT